jgi:hypothetical protein
MRRSSKIVLWFCITFPFVLTSSWGFIISPIRTYPGTSLLYSDIAGDCFESDGGNAVVEFVDLFNSAMRRETFAGIHLTSRKLPPVAKKIDLSAMKGALASGKEDSTGLNGNNKISRGSPNVLVTDDLIRVTGRLVNLKTGIHLQLNAKYKTNDQAKNFAIEGNEATSEIKRLLKVGAFKKAELLTETVNYELSVSKSTQNLKAKSATNPIPDLSAISHDRKKNVPVETNSAFLQELGVVNKDGRPMGGMKDKLRQIEKFVEVLSGLVYKVSLPSTDVEHSSGVSSLKLAITDMGSGLAYLTFASHSFFSQSNSNSNRHSFANVTTVGVESRKVLVDKSNALARKLGRGFEGLSFQHAAIQDLHSEAPAATAEGGEDTVKVVIALHACDKATDFAIYNGIKSGANVIVTSPCCHKELRPQLDSQSSSSRSALLSVGIFRERMCEMVTDTIRAKCLQLCGYDVTVAEFVGGEHTAKNVMISAVKKPGYNCEGPERKAVLEEVRELTSSYGVSSHQLVSMLELEEVLVFPPPSRGTKSSKLHPRLKRETY